MCVRACRCDWLLITLFAYHYIVRKDTTDPAVRAVRPFHCHVHRYFVVVGLYN